MNKQERADFREIVEPVLLNSGFIRKYSSYFRFDLKNLWLVDIHPSSRKDFDVYYEFFPFTYPLGISRIKRASHVNHYPIIGRYTGRRLLNHEASIENFQQARIAIEDFLSDDLSRVNSIQRAVEYREEFDWKLITDESYSYYPSLYGFHQIISYAYIEDYKNAIRVAERVLAGKIAHQDALKRNIAEYQEYRIKSRRKEVFDNMIAWAESKILYAQNQIDEIQSIIHQLNANETENVRAMAEENVEMTLNVIQECLIGAKGKRC